MLRLSVCVWSPIVVMLAMLGCASEPNDNSNGTSSTDSSDSDSSGSGSGSSESGDSGTDETGNPLTCMDVDGCADDEWCDFPDNLCGAGEPGTCTPRPSECGDDEVSVCGCDGMVYSLACVETVGGVDKNQDASVCTPAPDDFACGDLLCYSGSFYCQVQVSDVGGIPNSYACIPLPDACNNPVDCTCLVGELCGENCEATGAGFTVTCPGG